MRYKEAGYEHEYDTGNLVLTDKGIGLVVGLRIRLNPRAAVYFVVMDETKEEITFFNHEILGYATKVMRNKNRQIETLPGL